MATGLDAATGAVVWSRPVRVAPYPPPTVLLARDGRVYLSEVDSVMAMDAATGRTVWTFHPDSQAVVEPALDATTLYTGQRGVPVVYALDNATGALRWRTNVGARCQAAAHVTGVAVRGDTVDATVRRYFTRNLIPSGIALVALDRTTGRELWRYETPAPVPVMSPADTGNRGSINAPLLAGRYVVITDVIGVAMFAVDPSTQRVAWYVPLTATGGSRAVYHDGVVYVASLEGAAYAIAAATGALRWRAGGFGSANGGEYCSGSYFLEAQRLQRLDAPSGRETGDVSSGAYAVFTSDVVSDGTRVYFTGGDGTYAVSCH